MNASSILPILLQEFHDKIVGLKDLVDRDVRFPKAPNKIKVAIGMRRSGKTYFLYQTILKLLEDGADQTSILYINFEDDRLVPLNEKKMAEFVDAFYALYPENHDKKCYFFFDEIQTVEQWPLVIRRLHDSKRVEIFLTGSSAKLLSKEIATSLRGRSLAIEIWPYSFQEFRRAKKLSIDQSLYREGLKNRNMARRRPEFEPGSAGGEAAQLEQVERCSRVSNSVAGDDARTDFSITSGIYGKKTQDKMKHAFQQYLSEGGFPEILSFDPAIKQQTLQEYLNVTIYRDIVERYEIAHPVLIKYMILSMIHNVGKPFAINKFYNDAKSQGYQTGKDILYEYASYIEDAYLAFSIPLYDLSIRKIQTNPKKIYAVDPGLIRALTLEYEKDFGRLFENVIYLELRRLGFNVNYYLTAERYEVDFLAKTPRGAKILIHVAWEMDDPATMAREQRA